ncbi:MAG TPA: hypothetical protein VF139_08555 [Candidatus Polarisedimenticolaceae bacterium]
MLRFVVAAALSLLPRRTWPPLSEHVPIRAAAVASAAATVVAGIVFGGLGFLDYATQAASGANEAMLDAARSGRQVATTSSMFLSMFSSVAYALGTWSGRLATYLVLSGFVRGVAALLDDPFGDPILTGLHRLAVRWRERRRERIERTRRENLEGEEAPDLLLPAERFSLEGATWVVLASRRKPGWERGVTVLTDDGWFLLGEPFDVEAPQGLRRAYPLAAVRETEVLRAAVRYAMPRGTGRGRTP